MKRKRSKKPLNNDDAIMVTILGMDGAPPHYARPVRDFLNLTYSRRWIGRGGHIAWPSRSPDLTSDFFLWGYFKNTVYQTLKPEVQVLTKDKSSPAQSDDGEMKQSSFETANVEVNLPTGVAGEPDRNETQPTVLTEKSEDQVRAVETSVSPVPSTSGVLDSVRAKPKRYRSVSREIGKEPDGEVLFRSVLEVLGDSEDSGDE
ncbi:hypothetical protein RF55_13774, partial [Lasius niger]